MLVSFPLPSVQPRTLRLGVLSLSRVVWKHSKHQKVFFPGQMNFKLSSWLFCSIAFFFLPRMERPTHTHNYRSNKCKWGFCLFLKKRQNYRVKVPSSVIIQRSVSGFLQGFPHVSCACTHAYFNIK